MQIGLNLLLVSVGLIQGLIVSYFLLRNTKRTQSQIYFTLFILVVALQLTFKAIAKSWLWQNVQLVYLLSYSLPLLIGPLLYLFIQARQGVRSKGIRNSLHFLPFIVHITHTFTIEVFGYNFPTILWQLLPGSFIEIFSLLIYGWASWKILDGESKSIIKAGLRKFVVLVVSVETIIVITITMMVNNIQTFPDVRWLFIVLTLLIYWISYRLMSSPEIFRQTEFYPVHSLTVKNTIRYAHSGLKPEEAENIVQLLHRAIHVDKVFLEPDLTLEQLSHKLSVPRHHLSRVINERFSKTYTDLANGWRLAEAQSRLSNPQYNSESISSIAFDCGFRSISSFTTMFKRQVGQTPTTFRKLTQREKSA